MNFLPLIEAKRDGRPLAPGVISEIVAACTTGLIPDYQMVAFLMAVCFRGLDPEETRALTLSMRDSGETLRFPPDPRPLVDKHSTGGVGDKVSLPLAPLLACLGFRVPMISGRGLGITGGTLDKLDAIPGFQTVLSLDRVRDLVQRVGCVICGQTERMVPADRKLYALRDATGTVPSISLIVASILSKKLAEQLDALVLDVKYGAAAFMQTPQAAEDLAQAMATLGNQCGVRTRAVLTNMDIPLGRAAGNWLEVRESVACLEGRGPADLNDLVLTFAAHLLVMTGKSGSYDDARRRAHECLASGQPAAKWREMLAAQGADLEAYDRKLKSESNAASMATLAADRSGFVTRCDARILGEVVRDLGAGRLTRESAIDYDVGVDGLAKPGEQVAPGQVLARIHAQTMAAAENAREKLSHAISIGDTPPDPRPLILKQIGT